MFSNASNFVHGVDKAFLIIGGFSIFFLVSFTIIMIYFVVKYNRKKHPKATQVKDNTLLEVTWTTLPVLLVIYMFYIGWEGFLPMRQAPKDAMEIVATGKMWSWVFEYPGQKQADTLVVPINKPVKVNLISRDVLHGFFVPAFRIKEDVVPGQTNYSWFISGQLGEYDLFCSAYCGVNHSYMSAIVKVVPQKEFDRWYAALPVKKKEDDNLGLKVIDKNGCTACHTLDGKSSVGPTFKGLYGSQREVSEGGNTKNITVDSEYIVSSIYDPNKDIVSGFPPGVMKSYKGIIKEEDIKLIEEYLKSLK